ncbi:unnamed protein product, partial [Hydatigera taeniaeformis]|uniref:Non-specific serine/threonine protein kinase n=1 Tax=Hydatigena taeniaeformis TaxID=6205 RepID=A0A0R3WSQ2_HYDTA
MQANESKSFHWQRKTSSIERIPTALCQQPASKCEPTSARQPLTHKQFSQEYERSSSLSELIAPKLHRKEVFESALGASVPVDRDLASKLTVTSPKSGNSIYDRVAAALNHSENLPVQILGLPPDHRRHSAFASTTTHITASIDHTKSTSGSSQQSSGSSYTGSVGKQHTMIAPATLSSSTSTVATTTSKSHVSTHVRQRLKDCVLNKRRSKESVTTGSGTASFVSPSMELDEDRGPNATGCPNHTIDSERVFNSGYGVSQMMCTTSQLTPGQRSAFLTDTGKQLANLPPWVFIALSAGQEIRFNIDASMVAPRNTSVLLRKTLSEPSLKVRGSSGGLKHKTNRSDRRSVNPLAVAAAVASSAPYFSHHTRGSRSISEAGDVGQCLGLQKTSSRPLPTLSQLTLENKELSKHSEENDNTPMEVASEVDSRTVTASMNCGTADVDMNETHEAMSKSPQRSDDNEAVQEFLAALATNPVAMSGGLLKATQNYLTLVREYMKQEKNKNSRGGSPKSMDQSVGLSKESSELCEPGRGRQQPSQAPYRRCKQVSGLLSRT